MQNRSQFSRNRHGRGVRGLLLPTEVPRYRTRRELFDAAVLEAYSPLQEAYGQQLAHLDLAVDTIPRMRLHSEFHSFPDEIVADGPIPLGRVIPAGVDARGRATRARIVIFRMPIEQRAANAEQRQEILENILIQLVAEYLNIRPEDIDPSFNRLY
ncbi:MAG: metallopeptidase family protein [Corynebacterium sp.]|uniref:metallopeptidase family protein n=1 Tax=Corynebacterium sp. TaxID=1720 RepID=UPI0026DD0373|nr:metallopeptidase family protein [Corynebacterium sp.]MDO4761587.1 metallopeptidase family protein [Corynebacterium sp.]